VDLLYSAKGYRLQASPLSVGPVGLGEAGGLG